MAQAAFANRKPVMIVGVVLLLALLLLAWLGTREYAEGDAPRGLIPTRLTHSEQTMLGIKAAPILITNNGGISNALDQKALVQKVGAALVAPKDVARAGWKFQFHLLAEPDILDAFALPDGQIFITTGLLNRLTTEGQLAAVLAHQVAHVLARDAMRQLAVELQEEGVIIGAEDPQGLDLLARRMATLRYSTAQETAADAQALGLMAESGYNPEATIGLFRVLSAAYYAGAQVEYFRTHPNPAGRMEAIQAAIAEQHPKGVPDYLSE